MGSYVGKGLPSEPSLLFMMGPVLYRSSMNNHSCREFRKAIAPSHLSNSIPFYSSVVKSDKKFKDAKGTAMVPVFELGRLTASDHRKLFRVMETSRWLWWYLVGGKSCHSAQLNNWVFCLYTKFIKAGEGTKSPYRATSLFVLFY